MSTAHPWPCGYPARPLCTCPRAAEHSPERLLQERTEAEVRADAEAARRARARVPQCGRSDFDRAMAAGAEPADAAHWAQGDNVRRVIDLLAVARTRPGRDNPLRGLIAAFDAEARRIEQGRNTP